ncbi:o-succinylbenzoate--CoA ligase [Virgibacillus flavescens]|uniref:o-succinylbenzoate--CoA ligase n=1 Tax=Virgibacillus flavescens TaxID=1611422 RepID=UPI003D33A809
MAEVIPHWLTKQASLAPNDMALELEDGNYLTFEQLKNKSQSFAKKLVNQGVDRGSKVGIYSTNCPEMVIAIHALSYLGATAVMLNIRLAEQEIIYQLNDADVSLILADDELVSTVLDMELNADVLSFSKVNSKQEMIVELVTELSLDDPFTIMYTSGTTGNPKGVVHTYGNHWWSATGSALNLGIHSTDKWLAVLPLFHIGGFSILLKSVIYGMPVLLLEKFNENTVQHAIMKRGVTIASVVTVMLQRLIHKLDAEKYPDTFRCMLLGGGPVPESTLEISNEKQLPVFQSYGMTETSSQIVTLSLSDALRKSGSAGKPLFPAQLRINNPNDEGVGEIVVKGPMVSKGYYKNIQANSNSFVDGWLLTGDLGKLDDEGFLYVVDRRNDLIISGGENIYPSEIESVLTSINGVHEAGVTGIEDSTWGQVPIAFIVSDSTISAKAILADAAKSLAKYKVPRKIYFVKELPRNASNKLVRNKLTELISE